MFIELFWVTVQLHKKHKSLTFYLLHCDCYRNYHQKIDFKGSTCKAWLKPGLSLLNFGNNCLPCCPDINKSFLIESNGTTWKQKFNDFMHESFMTLSIKLMNNKTTLCFDTRLRHEHLVEILFFSFYRDHQYLIERKNNKNNSLAWWIIFVEKSRDSISWAVVIFYPADYLPSK